MSDLIKEIKRQHDITDMLLTMHSIRRDTLNRRAFIIDITLLVSSFILLMVELIDPSIVSKAKIDYSIVSGIGKVSALIVFVMSLFVLRVDWKGRAINHGKACGTLSKLKFKARQLLTDNHLSQEKYEEFQTLYSIISNSVDPIEERFFNKLKAKHKSKVELSKLVSKFPGCPEWYLKAKLIYHGVSLAKKTSVKVPKKHNCTDMHEDTEDPKAQ